MTHTTMYGRTLFLLPLLTALAASPAMAQGRGTPVPNAAASLPSLEGSTLQKQPFRLSALKGKVVLLMFWSTDCPVCREQMAELRENVQGWANKPFELVLVSVDKNMKDVDSYNAILNASVPTKQRFTQLWAGDAGFKDNLGTLQAPKNQLPATFLIDKTGKLVERYNGRVPAQAWDAIADLL
ncbi:MAG: TlpA disulfide reductase family protein [Burkholderiaceae bacterium]